LLRPALYCREIVSAVLAGINTDDPDSEGQMRRFLLIFGMFMILTAGLPAWSAEPVIKEGERLTLDQCIDIAVKNQPSILQYFYTSQVNEALLGQAKSSYYPQLDVKSNYTSYNSVTKFGDPNTTLTQYGYNYIGNNIGVQQKIYDFGKREANVDVARLNMLSAQSDTASQITTVANNVKSAYYNVLRANRTRDVNVESRDQYLQQLAQAKLFFEAGKKPKYDVTTAEVNLSNAEVNLINAENDLDNAWVTLNNAMGYDGPAKYTIQDTLTPEPYQITEREALDHAYKNRQDLKSLLIQKASAERAVEAAKKDYFPSLDASAGYDFAGSQSPLSQGWNAGVTLSWNLFKGMSTKKAVEKETANLKVTEAKIATLKLSIQQDIKKALLDLRKARKTIASAEIQVKQATENLELANLRYRTGLGTPLDVMNAAVSYSNAKLTQIAAVYQHIVSKANIEKAMGNR
jgi:outer membrane protein